ncbi:MAG: 50S ribosomal protein L5 [Candidatus Omnitrophica bacterium]|nr:50S ribosomal protein L5 [Candidatus Omnitrophota bacterium]
MTTAKRSHNGAGHAPRMLEQYRKQIAPALAKEFGHKNLLAVARLEKIVVNVGCGEASHDAKVLEQAQRDLGRIAGQRPAVTRAKKAISNFHIKEGDPVGCKVTLRRARMYEFLDRLISAALPRIRDFRGLSPKGFDQGGNYSFGVSEQAIFPELADEQLTYPLGLDVVMVTSAKTQDEAFALLKGFGMPFAAR